MRRIIHSDDKEEQKEQGFYQPLFDPAAFSNLQKAINFFSMTGEFPHSIEERIAIYEDPLLAYQQYYKSPYYLENPNEIEKLDHIQSSSYDVKKRMECAGLPTHLNLDFFVQFKFNEFHKQLRTYAPADEKKSSSLFALFGREKNQPIPLLITQLMILQDDLKKTHEKPENLTPYILKLIELLSQSDNEIKDSHHPMYNYVLNPLKAGLTNLLDADITTLKETLQTLNKNLIGGLDAINLHDFLFGLFLTKNQIQLNRVPLSIEKFRVIARFVIDGRLDEVDRKTREKFLALISRMSLTEIEETSPLLFELLENNYLISAYEKYYNVFLLHQGKLNKFAYIDTLINNHTSKTFSFKEKEKLIAEFMHIPFYFLRKCNKECSPSQVFTPTHFQSIFIEPIELAAKRLLAFVFSNLVKHLMPASAVGVGPGFTLDSRAALNPYIDVVAQARWLCIAPYIELSPSAQYQANAKGCALIKTLEDILFIHPECSSIAVEIACVLVELSELALDPKENIELFIQHKHHANHLARAIYICSGHKLFESQPHLFQTLCNFISSEKFFAGLITLHKTNNLSSITFNDLTQSCLESATNDAFEIHQPIFPSVLRKEITHFLHQKKEGDKRESPPPPHLTS